MMFANISRCASIVIDQKKTQYLEKTTRKEQKLNYQAPKLICMLLCGP